MKSSSHCYNPYNDPKYRTVWKQSGYIIIIVVALLIVIQQNANSSSSSTTSSSPSISTFWNIVLRHEPSWRIFRSLLEMNLILFMMAMLLYIWKNYLRIEQTSNHNSTMMTADNWIEQLLFQPVILTPITKTTTTTKTTLATQDEEEEEEAQDEEEDEIEVQFYHDSKPSLDKYDNDENNDDDENDVVIDNNNDNNNEKVVTILIDVIHQRGQHGIKDNTEANNDNNDGQIMKDPLQQQIQKQLQNDDENDEDVSDSNSSAVPLPRHVLTIAFDMLILILVTLFLYIVASSVDYENNNDDRYNYNKDHTHDKLSVWDIASLRRIISRVAAPIFPLGLFIYLVFIKTIYPWTRTKRNIWIVVYMTTMAPLLPVTFRDGFIGDILTSIVRPMQDIAFTACYIIFGLQGYWSNYYFDNSSINLHRNHTIGTVTHIIQSSTSSFVSRADAVVPTMEESWLFHTILLPACMISPLWWRFLQTIRQVYDTRTRFPVLGNTFKYFIAAQVAMVGIYQPHYKSSSWVWFISFIVATCYQIYWDFVWDWNLVDGTFPYYKLRHQRLYSSTAVYYIIGFINIILRFGWTLSFIPVKYLDAATGMLQVNDIIPNDHIIGPFLASAEIIRRSLWGLLRVEWEIIKIQQQQKRNALILSTSDTDEEIQSFAISPEQKERLLRDQFEQQDMKPMTVRGSDEKRKGSLNATARLLYERLRVPLLGPMSEMDSIQVLMELSIYTTIFAVLGFIWGYHRGTL